MGQASFCHSTKMEQLTSLNAPVTKSLSPDSISVSGFSFNMITDEA